MPRSPGSCAAAVAIDIGDRARYEPMRLITMVANRRPLARLDSGEVLTITLLHRRFLLSQLANCVT